MQKSVYLSRRSCCLQRRDNYHISI